MFVQFQASATSGLNLHCSNFLLKLPQLWLWLWLAVTMADANAVTMAGGNAVTRADGNAGVAADREHPKQEELQWEIHERGAELQVHGIRVPLPSELPGMPANTPLTDLNVTLCLSLKVTDLCVHIAKKRATGEATNMCAHLTAVHTEASPAEKNMADGHVASAQAEAMTAHVLAESSPEFPSVPIDDSQAEIGGTQLQTVTGNNDTRADDMLAADSQTD